MSSTTNVCQAKTKRGRPCRAYAVEGSAFCFWHAPDKRADRAEACAKGGRARHGRTLAVDGGGVRLTSLGDVALLLQRAAVDLVCLENSVARARALAYVASVAVRALQVGDLEERISALEEKLGV